MAYYYKKQRSRDEELEQSIISRLAPNLREELIYQSHIEVFENVAWMKYFSPEFIKALAFSIEELNYPKRESIYIVRRELKTCWLTWLFLKMGDDTETEVFSTGLYFIKDGSVECYIPFSHGRVEGVFEDSGRKLESGFGVEKRRGKKNNAQFNKTQLRSPKKEVFLSQLGPLQHFGETSIFLDLPIPFSVKSLDFTTVYKISRKNFIETIQKFPDDYVRGRGWINSKGSEPSSIMLASSPQEVFCEIKEKLEFSSSSEKFKLPLVTCEVCTRDPVLATHTALSFDHNIDKCPSVMPSERVKVILLTRCCLPPPPLWHFKLPFISRLHSTC